MVLAVCASGFSDPEKITIAAKVKQMGKGVSKWDRDTGPRILRMLIKAGADVTAPLHCTGSSASGPLHPGTAALIDALRLIVVAAKRNDQIRRARAALIAPILIEALSVASHLSAVDLMFWAGLPGGPEVAACVVARQLPILMPPHASSTTSSAAATAAAGATALWLQPALIAAVDCGSAAAVKLLLEAGASPDEVSWCRRGVAGTDAAPATGGGREPVAGETPLMRCAGDFAVALPPPDLFGIHRGDYSVGTVTAAAAATSATAGVADVAGEEDSGETDALVHRPTRAMLEALLHAGANADARDSTGRTALHHFAASDSPALRADPAGRLSLALRLLHAGADVGALDQAGRTASQAAALARPGGEQRFVRGLAAAVEEARRKAAAAAAAAAPSSPPTSPKKENSMHS